MTTIAPGAAAVHETTPADLEHILTAAASAAGPWAATTPAGRAIALAAIASSLEEHADELVELAVAETHLTEGRLRGEVVRTAFQLRLLGDFVASGSHLDVTIDPALPGWPPAPRPDLRRTAVPIGPVLVFAASNFPFAFSVVGGDTASALAAGCPVIVKANPGHPTLSRRTAELTTAALEAAGAPAGVFAMIEGRDAGTAALVDPRVRAGAFTGSTAGGRALFDLAVSRAVPIPFYAEMGSINPIFVTATAATDRPEELMDEFVASFTLGSGQFCTKPGFLVVPAESRLTELARGRAFPSAQPLLNDHILAGYRGAVTSVAELDAVETVVRDGGWLDPSPTPTLFELAAEDFLRAPGDYLVECFGPAAVMCTYRDDDELLAVADAFDGQLTAGIHGTLGDPVLQRLVPLLADRAGRLLWNGWPTGVAVTAAQQHGGPYPATTVPGSTSVGTAAVLRFLRPVAYQDFPKVLLPPELRTGG